MALVGLQLYTSFVSFFAGVGIAELVMRIQDNKNKE